MSEKIHLDFTIPDSYAGKRLDQVLSEIHPEHSRSRWQSWIKENHVLVNHQSARPKDKLEGGEHILLDVTLANATQWHSQAIPLTIVYEDDDLLIIDKPAGLVVHPAAGNPDNTLVNALLYHHKALEHLPRAGIVHRLDKDTTGLLVVAKTLTAHTHLVRELQQHQITRQYCALVNGPLIAGDTIDAPIGRHPKNRLKMTVIHSGKPAVTHYRIRQRYSAHTLLEIKLETGRTHQIRVHMAHIRHSIVGDKLYGGRPRLPKNASEALKSLLRKFPRQALHAERLELTHPNTHKSMHFVSNIPMDMQTLINGFTV